MRASRGMGDINPDKMPKSTTSPVLLKKGGTAKKRPKKFSGADGESKVNVGAPTITLASQLDPAAMTQSQRDQLLSAQAQADLYTGLKEGGKVGLYENIHRKQARIAAGSGEKMRKPGTKGAPTKADFVKSAKTARKK